MLQQAAELARAGQDDGLMSWKLSDNGDAMGASTAGICSGTKLTVAAQEGGGCRSYTPCTIAISCYAIPLTMENGLTTDHTFLFIGDKAKPRPPCQQHFNATARSTALQTARTFLSIQPCPRLPHIPLRARTGTPPRCVTGTPPRCG
jgi:hypothetical protein